MLTVVREKDLTLVNSSYLDQSSFFLVGLTSPKAGLTCPWAIIAGQSIALARTEAYAPWSDEYCTLTVVSTAEKET